MSSCGTSWWSRPGQGTSEQAGGQATDGATPILDLAASELHQRTPLILGSTAEVARIGRYHALPSQMADRAPLFGKRGLFRA